MFGRIKRAFWYVSDNTRAALEHAKSLEKAADVANYKRLKLKDVADELAQRVSDRDRTIASQREMLATQSHLREQAENEVERLTAELKNQLEEYGSIMSQLQSADAAAQTLREELAAERKELEDVRQDLARTEKQLELASQENRLLSEIHEADFQRRRKEKELEITQSELAIAEARKYNTEQHFETA